MPLKLNVGLARKVGEASYGSRGASVNVEMELDSALVSEPIKLRERMRQLFDVVRASLTEELNGSNGTQAPANPDPGYQNGTGQQNGNAHAPQNGNVQAPVRPATQSQVKAIHAIARSQRLDVGQLLRDRFQRDRPEGLSIKEASNLIDDLKRKEK